MVRYPAATSADSPLAHMVVHPLQLALVVLFHPPTGANTALALGQLALCGGIFILYIYIYIYIYMHILTCTSACISIMNSYICIYYNICLLQLGLLDQRQQLCIIFG